MSNTLIYKETCPKCGKENKIERYSSLNSYDEKLFPTIVDKTIFAYRCKHCKENIYAPYPFLFHKIGIPDVQIGYKMKPFPTFRFFNPMMATMKKVMENNGYDTKDILEYYDDENEFVNRVKQFL